MGTECHYFICDVGNREEVYQTAKAVREKVSVLGGSILSTAGHGEDQPERTFSRGLGHGIAGGRAAVSRGSLGAPPVKLAHAVCGHVCVCVCAIQGAGVGCVG